MGVARCRYLPSAGLSGRISHRGMADPVRAEEMDWLSWLDGEARCSSQDSTHRNHCSCCGRSMVLYGDFGDP